MLRKLNNKLLIHVTQFMKTLSNPKNLSKKIINPHKTLLAYFSILPRYFSKMMGARCNVIKIKWVYKLLYSIFIPYLNKVIR